MRLDTKKLEAIPKTLGFSKTAFADFIGISRPTYSNMLKNGHKFKTVTIARIAAALRMKTKDLIIF